MFVLLSTAADEGLPTRELLGLVFIGVVIVALWLTFRKMRPD